MKNKLSISLGAAFVLLGAVLNCHGQSTTNLMPSGYSTTYIGMTTNALTQARPSAEWTSPNPIPSPDATERTSGHIFFKSVGYDFALTNTLQVVTFYALDYTQYAPVMPGFVKG
jgi:hypothetical protein